MEQAAALAERFSHGELRVTHDQNLLLPWVRESDLLALWQAARDGRLRDAEHRPAHRHDRLPRRRLLRAGQRALDPGGRSRSPSASPISTSCTTSATSTCTSAAASTPAATTTAATSASSASTRTAAEWYQVTLGGSDGSTLSGALGAGQGDRPVVRRRRGGRRDRGGDRHLPRASARAGERFIDTVRRVGARRLQGAQPTPCGAAPRTQRDADADGTADPHAIHRHPPRPLARRSAARTARPVSITPAPHLLLDARAVARGARTLAGDDAGRRACCPTTPDVEAHRGRPAAPRAGGAAVPEVDRRPRLQPGPAAARRATASHGEVRAIGEVLVDMLPLLQRTGFDAVQLRADQIARSRRARAGLLPRPLPGRRARSRAAVRARPARRGAGRAPARARHAGRGSEP